MDDIFFPKISRSMARAIPFLICAFFWANVPLRADDATDAKSGPSPTPVAGEAPAEPQYNNWIELSIGGLITSGDTALFEQQHHVSGDVFGGIHDLHLEQTFDKNAQFSMDGHAIFDTGDYNLTLSLSKPDLGYIKAGYDQFRSYYDGNGGFFPVDGTFLPPPIPEMYITRGIAWFEMGLQLPDWPEIIIRYSHEFRQGQKDSTEWGDTTVTGLPPGASTSRKIVPSYRDINEARDIVSLEASKTFGNTDVGLGMRYEHENNNNDYNFERGAGATNQRFVTDKQSDNFDLFSGHATTETRFSDSLWLTTAYSYTTLTSDLSGSRIYGPFYYASYSDPITTLGGFDHGYLNLAGTSNLQQWVINANLMWVPLKELTILTAFRYTYEDKQSDSVFLETARRTDPLIPTAANSFENFNTFAETMELRFTGLADWLFYAKGDWEEQTGDIHEALAAEGTVTAGIKNLDLLRQQYTVGFTWYPTARLNLAGQYFYKAFRYDNSSNADGQNLEYQTWSTNDFNIRLTWRPNLPPSLGTLALVTRYDYTTSQVIGQWNIPDEILLNSEHTAWISNQVITESATWNPLARLYVQGDFSYVLNQTKTPAANIVILPGQGPTVLNFQSDYWTIGGNVGFLMNDKTEFRVGYNYYRAADYTNNALAGLPYGADQTENSVTASMSRQLTKSVRLNLQYGYYNYTDGLYGGHDNYQAHSIFSSLVFGF
jgi:hypothetical protein